MILLIKNPDSLYLDDFVRDVVIPEIIVETFSRIDLQQCDRWTNYFASVDLGWNKYGKKQVVPSAYDIIVQGLANLTYSKQGDDYRIFINNNQIVTKGCAKLNDICHLINYGNLSVSPYPLFSESFREVDSKLNNLYNLFMEE